MPSPAICRDCAEVARKNFQKRGISLKSRKSSIMLVTVRKPHAASVSPQKCLGFLQFVACLPFRLLTARFWVRALVGELSLRERNFAPYGLPGNAGREIARRLAFSASSRRTCGDPAAAAALSSSTRELSGVEGAFSHPEISAQNSLNLWLPPLSELPARSLSDPERDAVTDRGRWEL